MHPIDSDVLLSELPLEYFTGLATFGALSEDAVDGLLGNGSIVRLGE